MIDYLWGSSAQAIIAAIARAVQDAHAVRFVQVGESGGEPNIALPAAALRSSAILLMGSGLKSVPFPKLLDAIQHTFDLTAEGKLTLATKAVPLATVAERLTAIAARFVGLGLRAAFSATAARISSLSATSFTTSPSRMSIARRTPPFRLELNKFAGSGSDAPLANVNFTTLLYVSPVQRIPPPNDHTGTPRHFQSS